MDPTPTRPDLLAQRRWAPATVGLAAFTLIFGLFPNPLRPPPQNPNAQAEYAPRPPDTPNFNESALASSGGIGSGSSLEVPGDVQAPPPPPPPTVTQFVPRGKECVGDPPRQTEDPLSPPCVSYFDGDNGGRTWHTGVTRDEVTILLYNDWGIEGDLSGPYHRSQEPSGSFGFPSSSNIVRTIKAQLRFFERRFQTYGRRVRVWAHPSQGINTTCHQRRGDATVGNGNSGGAFAALDFSFVNATCFVDEIAKRDGVMTFGLNPDLPPEVYRRNAPLVYGFYPDQGLEAAWSAAFLCEELRGRPAEHAGDPALRDRPRRFAFIYPDESNQLDDDDIQARFRRELADRCSFSFAREDDDGGAGTALREYDDEGITTIVCHCSAGMVSSLHAIADDEEYRPEWFFAHGSGMLSAAANRGAVSSGQRAFGLTHHWLNPEVREQYHHRAYATEEPSTDPNLGINFRVYMQLLNLFTGIQAAGPHLTPTEVQRGMFTFVYQDQADGRQPTGGYGPYAPRAVGDYTFVDTVSVWWWDPEGTEPGRGTDGCVRLAHRGYRYYLQDWPARPRLFDRASAPCTADTSSSGGGGGGFFG